MLINIRKLNRVENVKTTIGTQRNPVNLLPIQLLVLKLMTRKLFYFFPFIILMQALSIQIRRKYIEHRIAPLTIENHVDDHWLKHSVVNTWFNNSFQLRTVKGIPISKNSLTYSNSWALLLEPKKIQLVSVQDVSYSYLMQAKLSAYEEWKLFAPSQ